MTSFDKRIAAAWVEADQLEAQEVQARIREDRIARGVCPFHPQYRISTGGGTPMYDGLCPACEAENDDYRD